MHTPGPWTLQTVTTSCGICHKVGPFPFRDDRHNHACIYVDYPGGGSYEAELLANARLIAAAPDLLEALKAVRDDAAELDDQITMETMNLVEAAIAKAEFQEMQGN